MTLIKNLHDFPVRNFSDFEELFQVVQKELLNGCGKIFILTGTMTSLLDEKMELLKEFSDETQREEQVFLAGLEMQTASYLAIYMKKKGLPVKTLCGFEIELCKNGIEENFSLNREVLIKKIGDNKVIIIPGPHLLSNTRDLQLLTKKEIKNFEAYLLNQLENLRREN